MWAFSEGKSKSDILYGPGYQFITPPPRLV